MVNRKKAFLGFGVLGTLIITLVVVAISVVIYQTLIGKEAAQASELISSSTDFDKDGIANIIDRCDCIKGTIKNEGCPTGFPIDDEGRMKNEEDDCKEKMAAEKSKS